MQSVSSCKRLLLLLLFFLPFSADSQIPQQLLAHTEEVFKDIFRGKDISEEIKSIYQQIKQADPGGKYPELLLKAYATEGWYWYLKETDDKRCEELVRLGKELIRENPTAQRKSWELAQADFWEWFGRFVRSTYSDGYRGRLSEYRAYALRKKHLPENHYLLWRSIWDVGYQSKTNEQNVELGKWIATAQLTEEMWANDPFMIFWTQHPHWSLLMRGGEIPGTRLKLHSSRKEAYLQLKRLFIENIWWKVS